MNSKNSFLGKLKNDRGASLVESAIVSAVFILFIFSIIEFGLYFRDYLTVKDATDIAATEASIAGSSVLNGRNADYAAVATIRNSTGVLDVNKIEKMIIWKAEPDGPLSSPPQECVASNNSIKGTQVVVEDGKTYPIYCNVYNLGGIYAIQSGDSSYFVCDEPKIARVDIAEPCGWPIDDRQNEIGSPTIDYVGVYLQTRHEFMTGFFGDGLTISNYSIKRLEVKRSESQRVDQ
jgi:hypothetical protein